MKDSREMARLTFLLDIMIQVAKQLCKQGEDLHQAIGLSRSVSVRLCQAWRGEQIYLPRQQFRNLEERDSQICAEFNGGNIAQIAHKHKLSEQRIYQIIGEVRKRSREGIKGSSRKGTARPGATVFDDMLIHVAKALCLKGVAVETAASIGQVLSDFLRQNWGGQLMYFPRDYPRHADCAAARAYARLEDSDIAIIAQEHEITTADALLMVQEITRHIAEDARKTTSK